VRTWQNGEANEKREAFWVIPKASRYKAGMSY